MLIIVHDLLTDSMTFSLGQHVGIINDDHQGDHLTLQKKLQDYLVFVCVIKPRSCYTGGAVITGLRVVLLWRN